MKCDLCNQPAVVHEVIVKSGIKREIHLCEQHAVEAGIEMPEQSQFGHILSQFVSAKAMTSAPPKPRLVCPGCSLDFRLVRKSGILGCPICYDAFESRLGPMIERAHDGGQCHCGKVPGRGGCSLDLHRQRQQLAKELGDAVAAEQYERAAKLRDRLRCLEGESLDPDARESH